MKTTQIPLDIDSHLAYVSQSFTICMKKPVKDSSKRRIENRYGKTERKNGHKFKLRERVKGADKD